MNFIADEAQTVTSGKYVYQAIITSGGVTMEMSMSGGAFSPITDGAFTADADGVIDLPTCRLKAGLTGDAVFKLEKGGS